MDHASSSSSPSSSEPFLPKIDRDAHSDVNVGDEEETDNFIPQPRPKRRLYGILSFISMVAILVLAMYSLINLVIYAALSLRKATLPPCRCGSSVEEALAMDCKYDSLSTSWLPAHCRDDELTRLFEHAGPGPNGEWLYHASNTSSSRLYTVEEVGKLADRPDAERVAYSTIDWHDKHCFYMLVKQLRGKSKMEYTGFPDATAHAEHCAVSMTEGIAGNKIVIGVFPGFGDPEPGELRTMMMME